MTFQSFFYFVACMVFIYVAYMYSKIFSHLCNENYFLKKDLYISIEEEDIRCLIRGGILHVAYMKGKKSHLIHLYLKDIGFERIGAALDDAENGKDIHKPHNKIISEWSLTDFL